LEKAQWLSRRSGATRCLHEGNWIFYAAAFDGNRRANPLISGRVKQIDTFGMRARARARVRQGKWRKRLQERFWSSFRMNINEGSCLARMVVAKSGNEAPPHGGSGETQPSNPLRELQKEAKSRW
jgi:hypothetical protein